METLVSDCFPPIFSYLSLTDLLNLRTVSRRLKQEVEDYLPTVRSLPLYLTTPRTPEEIARYEKICLTWSNDTLKVDGVVDTHLHRSYLCFRKLPFGNSGSESFEDSTILRNQDHFRRSDFLFLKHSSALSKFLPFIKKFCPNIEKLALVIDHCDHYLPEVSKVLRAFPAIKVLLLEQTMQDSYRQFYNFYSRFPEQYTEHTITFLPNIRSNFFDLPLKVYDSILALNHLEELYLFSKRQSQLNFLQIGSADSQYEFAKSLLRRLKVLHFNVWPRWEASIELPIDDKSEESIEELVCPIDVRWILNENKRLNFPKLKKIIHLGGSNLWWSDYNESLLRGSLPINHLSPRPLLKVFDICHDHHVICPISTRNLNSFIDLESFQCGKILVKEEQRRMSNEDEETVGYDLEIVPDNLKNRTIKHLQVTRGPKAAQERNRDARRWSKYFVALETSTFLEPKYKILISNFRN